MLTEMIIGSSRLEQCVARTSEIALEAGAEVATQPAVFYHEDVADYPRLHVPLDNIIDWVADVHNADPQLFQSMAVEVTTVKNLNATGSLGVTPEQFVPNENIIYAPIINLGLKATDRDTINLPRVNNTLRHELRHIFQPDCIWPLYARPNIWAVRSLAAAGALFFAHGAYKAGSPVWNDPFAAAGAAYTGSVLALIAASREVVHETLYTWSRREKDAIQFAQKHADFNPITLA